MKIILSLLVITTLFLLLGCSSKEEATEPVLYQWHGVLDHNPVAPNPNVIYREIPDENWVYYSKESKNFYLYTGIDWIVLEKEYAKSMVDSLNHCKTEKLKSLL